VFVIGRIGLLFALLQDPKCYGTLADSVPELARSTEVLSSDHPVLDVPAGVYTVASTWTISKPGVTIRGAGIGETILVRDPQLDGVMIRVNSANATISGMTLDGNGAKTVISLSQPGIIIDTIEVTKFTHIGIAVPASGCRITNSLVSGFANPNIPSIGIWYDAGRMRSTSTIMIDHNTIKDNGINGIYCTGGQVRIADNQLTGNHCATNPGGGQIDIGNAFTTNTVAVIEGNHILNGGGMKTGGIELGGGSFTLTNNTIRGHGLSGIGVGRNVIRATISGNTISNSGYFIGGKTYKLEHGAGISVGYGASNIEISGNRCFDDQANKTQTWGIILAPSPARLDPRFSANPQGYIVVKNNDLRGNIHPEGLLDRSAMRQKIISGNLPPAANR
jgi:hypothetical protein